MATRAYPRPEPPARGDHYRTYGGDEAAGLGDVELGGKCRFLERDAFSLALRPGLALPTGADEKGLGQGRAVPSLFFVASYEPAPWGFHLHLGYTDNRNTLGEREAIRHASVAATWSPLANLMLVSDLSTQTNPGPGGTQPVRSAVFGGIYSPAQRVDIDLGYRLGLSDAAPDDTALVGLTVRF